MVYLKSNLCLLSRFYFIVLGTVSSVNSFFIFINDLTMDGSPIFVVQIFAVDNVMSRKWWKEKWVIYVKMRLKFWKGNTKKKIFNPVGYSV